MTQRLSFQNAPKGFLDGLMKTEYFLKKVRLDPKPQDIIKYRVSQINGCAYCLDVHHKDAISRGETELRLYSLVAWKEFPYYSEKERSALAYAEVLTNANQPEVEDHLFETLSNLFSKSEITELTVAITQINIWNRINKALRTTPGNYNAGQYN